MSRMSAGLVIYRLRAGQIEVLLVHPGGPFFAKKDDGAWTIPKGEPEPAEDLLAAARREVEEEINIRTAEPFLPLTPVKQAGGKVVHAWGWKVSDDFDPAAIASNTFELEWPPRSGRRQAFPEIDRAEFFDLDTAKRKINSAQAKLIDELAVRLGMVV